MSHTPATILLAVDAIGGDTYETVHYRRCEYCGETACEDLWAGKEEEDWRQFYAIVGEGLIVCEHCLPRLEESTP